MTRRSPSGRLLSRVEGGASVYEGGQGETASQRDGFSAVAQPTPVDGPREQAAAAAAALGAPAPPAAVTRPASGIRSAAAAVETEEEEEEEESATAAAAAAAAAAVEAAGLQPAAAATIPSWARSMQGGDSRGVEP